MYVSPSYRLVRPSHGPAFQNRGNATLAVGPWRSAAPKCCRGEDLDQRLPSPFVPCTSGFLQTLYRLFEETKDPRKDEGRTIDGREILPPTLSFPSSHGAFVGGVDDVGARAAAAAAKELEKKCTSTTETSPTTRGRFCGF